MPRKKTKQNLPASARSPRKIPPSYLADASRARLAARDTVAESKPKPSALPQVPITDIRLAAAETSSPDDISSGRAPSVWTTHADRGGLPDEIISTSHQFMKKFFVAFGIVVLIGGGFAFYYFLRPARPDVGISFDKPSQALVGEPFTLTVSFSNYSNTVLGNARLSLLLPDGVSFLGQSSGQRVTEQSVGDMGPGSVNQQTFTVIALDGSQSVKRITATLSYGTANSKAQFETSENIDISVGPPALSLAITAPDKVVSGESFDITLAYQNNSSGDMKNIRLVFNYPPIFQFQKSSVAPDKGTNEWDVGTLAKGEEEKIVISGSVVGQEGYSFAMAANATADMLGQRYSLGSQEASLVIATSPLSITPSVNGAGTDFVAHAGDTLNYAFMYKNNAATPLENVKIRAAFSGDMLDFGTAESNASFDSLANAFTWNPANTPELADVQPNQSGSVSVVLRLKSAFPIRRISDKNYILKVQSQIESPTVPAGTAADKTVSAANFETKVAGALTIQTTGYFRDAPSGILNAGHYPPKVNVPTQYTIHWIITNYATDVSGIKVSASLQSNTRFTGKVKSTIDAAPAYDPASGQITWTIDNISATKGVIGQPIEAIFQIENTPAVNQIGQDVSLISETKIEGHDIFVDVPIANTAPAVTTQMPNDATFGNIDRRVQP